MQACVGKFHLSLDAGRSQHLAVAGLLDNPFQQRRLAHAGFTAQHENPAPTRPDIGEELGERTRLRVPPN